MKYIISFLFCILPVLFTHCKTTEESIPEPPPVIQEMKIEEEKIPESLDLTEVSIWNPNRYEEYTIETFSRIPKYHNKIDLKNIDISFLNACLFFELNRRREQMEIPPLKYSPALEEAAMGHSRDMVRLDFYSHRSPVPEKENPKVRMEKYGIRNAYVAEHINIGFGVVYQPGRPVFTPDQNEADYFSYDLKGFPLPSHTYKSLARSVVDSWMNSIPIRRNIMNENLTYTGIGSVHYKDSKFYGMDKFKITQKIASMPGAIPKN